MGRGVGMKEERRPGYPEEARGVGMEEESCPGYPEEAAYAAEPYEKRTCV